MFRHWRQASTVLLHRKIAFLYGPSRVRFPAGDEVHFFSTKMSRQAMEATQPPIYLFSYRVLFVWGSCDGARSWPSLPSTYEVTKNWSFTSFSLYTASWHAKFYRLYFTTYTPILHKNVFLTLVIPAVIGRRIFMLSRTISSYKRYHFNNTTFYSNVSQ